MPDLMPVSKMVEETARHHQLDPATAEAVVTKMGREVAAAHGDTWPFPGGGDDVYVHPTWLVGLRRSIDWHLDEVRRHAQIEQTLRDAATAVLDAVKALTEARIARDELVAGAIGVLEVPRIAGAASVSKKRVYQIRDEQAAE